MSSYKHFTLDYVEGVLVLRLQAAELLDQEVFAELLDDLTDVAHQRRPEVTVISFEFVKRLSSEAISVLLRARTEVAEHGGRIYLAEMRKEIREIFDVLKLGFPIYNTVNEALDAA